jgi:hypothetical protein
MYGVVCQAKVFQQSETSETIVFLQIFFNLSSLSAFVDASTPSKNKEAWFTSQMK